MKRKYGGFGLILALVVALNVGCGSMDNVSGEIVYTEVSINDLNNESLRKLYENKQRHIILNNLSCVYEHPKQFVSGIITMKDIASQKKLDGDIYYPYFQENPDIIRFLKKERTVSAKFDIEFDWHYKAVMTGIEGLPTVEEIEVEEAEARRLAQEKKQKEEEDLALAKKLQTELRAENDAKAKAIAKGYVYHGIDEVEESANLFSKEALENGHAYYITDFRISKYHNDFATTGSKKDILVTYSSQSIKGKVPSGSLSSGADVVVVGEKNRPKVIGFVGKTDDKLYMDIESRAGFWGIDNIIDDIRKEFNLK